MLRILTSLIRNAPGPFRGARALAADLVEGLIDVVSPPPEVVPPPPPPPPPQAEASSRPETGARREAETRGDETKPAPAEARSGAARSGAASDLVSAFEKATGRADWVRRQDFKVLAIFWEAHRRGMGPLTAKQASTLGDEIGLTIRHENVRKVVRTRLSDSIETSTVPDSQPPTFEYEMSAGGVKQFESEFLAKA